MKNNWQTKKLKELCDLQNGFAFKSKDYITDSNTMNFRMSQIRPTGTVDLFNNPKFLPDSYAEKYKSFLLDDGDIVVAMTDLATETKILGVPTIVHTDGKKLLLNQRVGRLIKIDFNSIYVPFLKYALTTPQVGNYYKSLGRGGLQINISKVQILNVEISYPDISEQKRIVKILDEVFVNIDIVKKNIEKNLQNSKELFETYLNNAFINNEIDWQQRTLADVCIIQSKLIDPRQKKFRNTIHVGAGNMLTKSEELINLKTSQEEGLISGKFQFDDSMVLYSKIRPYLMKVLRPDFSGICSADIYPLLPYKNLFRDYLYYLLLTSRFTEYAIKGSARAGMPKVNRVHLFAFDFYLPPLRKQKEIVKKLDEMAEQIKKLEANYKQKLLLLDELKKSVLAKAFSGNL